MSILQDIYDRPSSGEGQLPKWMAEYLLAEGHQRVACLLMRLGDSAAALRGLRKALELRQAICDRLETDPDLSNLPAEQKPEIQQSVATSHLAA